MYDLRMDFGFCTFEFVQIWPTLAYVSWKPVNIYSSFFSVSVSVLALLTPWIQSASVVKCKQLLYYNSRNVAQHDTDQSGKKIIVLCYRYYAIHTVSYFPIVRYILFLLIYCTSSFVWPTCVLDIKIKYICGHICVISELSQTQLLLFLGLVRDDIPYRQILFISFVHLLLNVSELSL